MVGLAAGGSEVAAAAGIMRRDAPERVAALAGSLRAVATGGPLDETSGRHLDVPLRPTRILIAGRGNRMLTTAGAVGDQALLWAVPLSDLGRSADRVRAGGPAEIVWAPLVLHDEAARRHVETVAVYAALNSAPAVRQRWGLGPELAKEIRAQLVRGGTDAAAGMVPVQALGDLVLHRQSPDSVAAIGRDIGARSIAVPSFDIPTLPARIAWAREVAAGLSP
jgi:hypothetical protein